MQWKQLHSIRLRENIFEKKNGESGWVISPLDAHLLFKYNYSVKVIQIYW